MGTSFAVRVLVDIHILANTLLTSFGFALGFNWKSLPENAVVADVGGGVGTVSLVLARELPKSVRIYLQDRPEVISGEAKAVRCVFCLLSVALASFSLMLDFFSRFGRKRIPKTLPQGALYFKLTTF